MATLDDLTRLKKRVEDLRNQKARADGALDQVLKRLKTEFGVSSLDEAKKLLTELQEKSIAAEREFGDAYDSLLKKHPELV